MFRGCLKIALRTIWKHKGYSLINVAVLAVGFQAVRAALADPVKAIRYE